MFRNGSFYTAGAIAVATALVSSAANAALIGVYEFAGNSPSPSNVATGVTMGDLVIGSGGTSGKLAAFNTNALRINGQGPTKNTIGAALTAGEWLRFTVTVAPGYSLNLDSVTVSISGSNVNNYSRGQVYSSVEGYDSTDDDRLGNWGFTSGGNHSLVTQTADLNSPPGANVVAADHDGLTGSITFTIPWIDDSSSTTRWVTVDDIALNGSVVPEPASVGLLVAATLLMGRRQSRR